MNIGGMVAIFFRAPFRLFINSYSVVPVLRVLYFIFALTMMAKTLITFRFCRETRQGKIRRAETKNVSVSPHAWGIPAADSQSAEEQGNHEGGRRIGDSVYYKYDQHKFLQPVCDAEAWNL